MWQVIEESQARVEWMDHTDLRKVEARADIREKTGCEEVTAHSKRQETCKGDVKPLAQSSEETRMGEV